MLANEAEFWYVHIDKLNWQIRQLNRALVSATITAGVLGLVAIVEMYMLLFK